MAEPTGDVHLIPAGPCRTEIMVENSRFLTTVLPVSSVDAAKQALKDIRAEMPDATHHVYAFRVGHGNSVIEGMSDDGEPSGTSGPPVLAVLRGSGLGDVLVIVTRYFGGTKLGTGGLVRAYSDAAREGLSAVAVIEKIPRTLLGLDIPYPLYEQVKRLVESFDGVIEDQEFAADVFVLARFPSVRVAEFESAAQELSAGRLVPVVMEEGYG